MLQRRYLLRDDGGQVVETPHQMLERVAQAVSLGELAFGSQILATGFERRFFELMAQGLFLPNSPTLMNAGKKLGQLSACFVLPVKDSLESIFDTLKQSALIHKSGGGTGFSFSRLRPEGDRVATTSGTSSGPLSFMDVFDTATEAVKQGGARRGANMAMLSASHPDILQFIKAKGDLGRFKNFNLSVMADDDFMERARAGKPWELINPRSGRVEKTVDAAELFDQLVEAAHATGDPGLAFYDAINRANPLPVMGPLEATNPCGEQPLMPYESCNLGSLVLPRFLKGGRIDYAALEEAAALAVRFLDDALEVNRFPLRRVAQATLFTRKIGLGVMGFADLLCSLGIPYDSDEAVSLGGSIMERIRAASREASRQLGKERGSFPAFERSLFVGRDEKTMRNATVTTIAPTGTLSLLMGCSAGIEPLFALVHMKKVLEGEKLVEYHRGFLELLKKNKLDTPRNLEALRQSGRAGSISGLNPDDARVYKTAHELEPISHLKVQAAFQAHTDNAVSKTINLPAEADKDMVRDIYLKAHELGLKGVTVFRSGCRGEQVLQLLSTMPKPAPGLSPAGAACPDCD